MVRTVRIGMVGAGFMARAHTLAYRNAAIGYSQRLPPIKQQRIADVSMDLARAGASRLDWQDAADDWKAITQADDIDLVDIVTPNDSHAEIAIDAARHGKHILCEKPLSVDAQSARQMYEAAVDAGVRHSIGFIYRQWPAVQFARKMISEGSIGQLLHFRGEYLHDYALDPHLPISWRFQAERAGAGAIIDIGSHVVDMARYLVGEVTRVMARSRTLIAQRPVNSGHAGESATYSPLKSLDEKGSLPMAAVTVDDATEMLVEFNNGVIGTIECSRIAAGHKCELGFEVQGTTGSIRFSWLHPNELQYYSARDPEDLSGFRTVVIGPMHPGAEEMWPAAGLGMGVGDAYVIAIRSLLSSIESGQTSTPNFRDGWKACEVIDAARYSATTNAWVEVSQGSA